MSCNNTLNYHIFTFHELSDANGTLNDTPPLTASQPSPPVTLNRNDDQHFVIKVEQTCKNIQILQMIIKISVVDHMGNDVAINNGELSGTLYNDYRNLRAALGAIPFSFFATASNPLMISFDTNTSLPIIDMLDFNTDGYMWIHLKLKVGAFNQLADQTTAGNNHKIKIKDDVVKSLPIDTTCEREFLITSST